MDPSEEIP